MANENSTRFPRCAVSVHPGTERTGRRCTLFADHVGPHQFEVTWESVARLLKDLSTWNAAPERAKEEFRAAIRSGCMPDLDSDSLTIRAWLWYLRGYLAATHQ